MSPGHNKLIAEMLPAQFVIRGSIENMPECNYELYLTEFLNASSFFMGKTFNNPFVFQEDQSKGQCDCYAQIDTDKYGLDFKLFGSEKALQGKSIFSSQIIKVGQGAFLLQQGYVVKVFDLIEPSHSDSYNPFRYIRKDSDVFRLISNFIQNTTPKNATQNDPFWEKSEIALDAALMLYLIHEAPPYEQTMEMMLTMIEYGGAKEDDDDYQSALDLLFVALEEEQPDHIAVRQYHIFKQAAGKTAKSILVSAAVRLASFTLREIQSITDEDTLELSKLGERKQAVFCVIPDSNDNSLNFLVGLLYTQAFQELYYQADKVHMGGLPVPVRLMFDEFSNVALPDGYARLQATMRSRNIMATIILQNISQLKALFKDDWEGIIGNADTMIYLGGNEQSTHKYISEQLGKETISTKSSSQSKGRNGSYSQSTQLTGRELMTPDEVRLLDNKNAIVIIRGERPVIDEKYDLMKHPNIRFTEDGGAAPYVHSPHCLYDMRYLLSTIETEESV